MAVEDSGPGISSAAAAGLAVIAVPNASFPPDPAALDRAALVLDSLHELTPATVEQAPVARTTRGDDVSDSRKVALVTGASGGIGAAVARRSTDAGASIGLLSRRGADLGLERGLGVRCDVRDRAQVERATAEVVERFGGLDVVVANAGVGAYGPFIELDPEHLSR